jgi:circadian clock protein KaiC
MAGEATAVNERTALPSAPPSRAMQLPKAPTGISGFDDLTFGGLPVGRPTLLCGAAGCGKTLFAVTFLVNGATQFDEAGVFMAFEEREEDLAANVASLGYDLEGLVAAKRLVIDHVHIERSEIEVSGEFDLEGLFVRLGYAIDTVGAKRVVLDTIEALFAGLPNTAILRAELRRLFGWLKERGVTAIVTAERAAGQLTRHGLEEYVSDCVVLLDHRVEDQITTRRLRVVKYRGSAHGTNEYPFLIDDQGISVLPITSAALQHKTSDEAVSTGIPGLDSMLGAGGYYRGSNVLISGPAGTGKTTFAVHFADASCRRGERCLYFGFEESPDQIRRNMRSVGIDLAPHVEAGLLRLESARPSLYGLETHLARMSREIASFQPSAVIVDPISAFRGSQSEIHALLLRTVDLLKNQGITGVLTSLSRSDAAMDLNERSVTSLMDTWISLASLETNGEHNRLLYVLKSRGMSHSNQVREFTLGPRGVELITPYIGQAGVLTGSARLIQQAKERDEAARRRQEIERRHRAFKAKRDAVERQIAELRASLEADAAEVGALDEQASERERDRARMAENQGAAE